MSPPEPDTTPIIVVVSRIVLHSWLQLPELLSRSGAIIEAAQRMPGNRRANAMPLTPGTWDTITAWVDDDALRQFVRSPLHAESMKHAGRLARATYFARTTILGDPASYTWREARALLRAQSADN